MGYYINPKVETKEVFLEQHGKKIEMADAKLNEEVVPVCLVDNGHFTAAGIAFCEEELEAFKRGFINGTDHRPYYWYEVPREFLKPFCAEL